MAEMVEMPAAMTRLVQALEAGLGRSGGGKGSLPMTSRKGMSDISKYSGKPGEYIDWKSVVIAFLRSEDLVFRKYLEFVEQMDEDITWVKLYEFGGSDKEKPEVREKIEWYDNQLYSMMNMKTTGDALALVRSVPEESEGKGAKVWKRITSDQEGMNALRMVALARRVMHPDKVAKYGDIVAAVEQWELRVKEYVKANDGFKMPESMWVNGICHIVPSEMEKEVMKLPTQKYLEIKQYVYSQVAQRKEPWFQGEKSGGKKDFGKNHQGLADMELDLAAAMENLERVGQAFLSQDEGGSEVQEEESEMKKDDAKEKMGALSEMLFALQRKGDGKGKGFKGNCHHCGKPGHRISECWHKDEEMRQKGKGGFGKGHWGGANRDQGKGSGNFQGGWQQGGKGSWGKGWPQGYQQQGYKGGGKGYGKQGGGKGNLNWCDGTGSGGGGWQQVQGGYQQLFSIAEAKIDPPPGLKTHNRFTGLNEHENEEEDELELLEVDEDEWPEVTVEVKPKQKLKMPKKVTWKPVTGMGHAMTLTAEPMEDPVHSLSGASWMHIDPVTKWRRVRSVMDSGASDCCSPPELAPEVDIVESPGSRRGQKYIAAAGKTIDNLGEKTVEMMTNAGKGVVGTWQMAEVTRPLNSVRKICQKGNRVIFEEDGGWIQNLYTGDWTEFGTEGDIYTLDLWLPPAGEAAAKGGPQMGCAPCGSDLGFTRPGWTR